MPRTVTRTRTSTKTFARIDLLELQIDRVLTRTCVSGKEAILRGIREGWIMEVSVYGVDASGLCWAELFIKIDWERHKMHLAAGRSTVSIDSRWSQDSTAVETDKTLALFERYRAEHGLHGLCHVRYRTGINRQQANLALGFTAADPIRWKGGHVGTHMSIPELDEFSIGVELIPD